MKIISILANNVFTFILREFSTPTSWCHYSVLNFQLFNLTPQLLRNPLVSPTRQYWLHLFQCLETGFHVLVFM